MKYWIACFLLAISQVHGVVIETTHFREITSYPQKDTLVLLDIDDTLLLPTQTLGSDTWFLYRVKQNQIAGVATSDAFEKSLAEWEAIRQLTKMEIVEPGTDKIVHLLQDQAQNQKFYVMGLTTQGLALATRTSQQLKENGFDLSLTAPSREDQYLLINGRGVLYRNGILFTSGASKGESLFALCKKIGYSPQRIVFINDKETHLKDVESAAESRGIECIGLRYAFADGRKKAFDPHLADYQFTHSTLHHLLSDEEAKILMQAEAVAAKLKTLE